MGKQAAESRPFYDEKGVKLTGLPERPATGQVMGVTQCEKSPWSLVRGGAMDPPRGLI